MKTKILHFLFILSFFAVKSEARHILGGTMSYSYLSDDIYEVQLTVFLDCSTMGAPFDDPAFIGIYRGNAAPYQFVQSLSVSPDMIETIAPVQDDCMLIPYPFCTEKGIYNFQVQTPDLGESYHIVYQRCCRGPAYNNIENPGETGFTIMTEITPEAFSINSSPVLSDQLTFETCSGDPFEFNIGATDDNADSIVYELCMPLSGGGPDGTATNPGDPSNCNGVQPNPACPPPYDTVTFVSPTYSFDKPLGPDSELQIDRYTGVVSGTPSILGQFLVGVCASEYLDGAVISVSRMELTFWVDFAIDVSEQVVRPLSFYPNPVEDRLLINLPIASKKYNLMIRDINGKIVERRSDISGLNYEVYTQNLQGMYFVELRSDDGEVFLGKVVVL